MLLIEIMIVVVLNNFFSSILIHLINPLKYVAKGKFIIQPQL